MHRLRSRFTPLLYPLGLLTQTIVAGRNSLYNSGFFQQYRLPSPVVSIGNLGLGGEGKTPLVIYIAALLRDFGVTAALLSRGYGRLHPERTHVVAPGNQVPAPWKNIGDEPALIRRYAPEMWIGISRNRYLAGCSILERSARAVFILDDGFQHRSIHRDLDIVVIDCSQRLPQNRVFPLGTLREPAKSLKRASALVLNTGPDRRAGDVTEEFLDRLGVHVRLFHCRQEIDAVIPLQRWQSQDAACPPDREIASAYLVAAVGNPERFRRDVAAAGIRIGGWRFFRDHREISTRDWFACADEARAVSADAILTTEKDAVKLVHVPDFPVFVARQATRVIESQDFKNLLLNSIGASIEAH